MHYVFVGKPSHKFHKTERGQKDPYPEDNFHVKPFVVCNSRMIGPKVRIFHNWAP